MDLFGQVPFREFGEGVNVNPKVLSRSEAFDFIVKDLTDATYQEKFPFVRTKQVVLKNVSTASGKTLRISDNPFLFKEVKVDSN